MNIIKQNIITKACISFIIILVLFSCKKNKITIINQSGYNLKSFKVQIEKTRETIFQLNYFTFKDDVSFKLKNSSIVDGEGRFVISYNTSNSRRITLKYFGYYTYGILDCNNQTIIIKKYRLIEKCNY
jgi:hypothetical protein